MLPKNEKRVVDPVKNIRMFIYGEPYTGKTTFASYFPDPVILSTDGNYQLLDTPAVQLTSLADWLKTIEELESGKHEFKTVIVDVVDQFFDIVRSEYLASKGKEHETDLNMKGWELVRKPFKLLLYRLASLPLNVIFIGHSKVKTVTDRYRNETSYTTYVLPEDVATYLTSLVTVTSYAVVEKVLDTDENGDKVFVPKHQLYLNSMDDSIKGGSRILFKKDKIDLDYDTFIEIFQDSVQNPIKRKLVDKDEAKPKKSLKPLKSIDKPAETKIGTWG